MIILKKENISKEEIMKILNSVINSEKKKYNIDPNVSIFTSFEYYKSRFKKENFSLKKAPFFAAMPHISSGYRDDKEIVIFFKNSYFKFKDIDEDSIIKLLITTYHELRHEIQHNCHWPFSDYENFVIDYLGIIPKNYYTNVNKHDSMYSEIDANLYALENVKNIIGDYISNKSNVKLNGLINRFSFMKQNFDFDSFFTLFCKNYENNYKLYKKNQVILSVFWKYGKFKRVNNIINSIWYDDVDIKVKNMILSSNYFLNNIDYELSEEETNILTEALEYRINELTSLNDINNSIFSNNSINVDDYKTNKLDIKNKINRKKKYLDVFLTYNIKKH